jgi:hypothetical protein
MSRGKAAPVLAYFSQYRKRRVLAPFHPPFTAWSLLNFGVVRFGPSFSGALGASDTLPLARHQSCDRPK